MAANRGTMYTDPEADEIRQAREDLLERLKAAPSSAIVPLDLGEVELSASCLAAILGPVLEEVISGKLEGRLTMGLDPTGRNQWDADAGLMKESDRRGKKLVCVWSGIGGQLDLVGAVDDQVRATYEFVARTAEEGATARDLAEQFRLSIQAASNRLAKAATLGIIYRAERRNVSGGGIEHVYAAVV